MARIPKWLFVVVPVNLVANSLAAEATHLVPNLSSVVTLPCFAVPNPVVPAPK